MDLGEDTKSVYVSLAFCTATTYLEDVNVCAEAFDALLDCVEDVLAAEADLVDHVPIVGGYGGDAEAWIVFVDAEVAFRQ